MKPLKVFSLLVAALLLAGGIFYIIKQASSKNKTSYVTENPAHRDLTQYVTASGTLKAKDRLTVGSLVAGIVTEVLAEDNDFVKKDQVLAIIDNGIGDTAIKRLKALLAESKALFAYTEQFYKRQQALYKSGQLSKNLFEQYTQDHDVAKARVEQTEAQLELETKTYNNLFIKSPAHGIVVAKKVDLGQMVTAQFGATVLFEIAKDLHNMEAYIDIDEADIGMIKEGQDALFTVDAFPKEKFAAKVKRIEYQAKIIDNVVTYATVLDVSNPELRLRPGMTTNVEIKVAEANKALSVSNKAFRVSMLMLDQAAKKLEHTLKKLSDGTQTVTPKQVKTSDHIWILENPTTIKQVEVQLGINDGKFTQISNGIDTNAQVIIDVEGIEQENILLKAFARQPGGIGR